MVEVAEVPFEEVKMPDVNEVESEEVETANMEVATQEVLDSSRLNFWLALESSAENCQVGKVC